ncbi:porin family protein [Hymenobacter sp. B81]|uniref:porin family protein n=1 Tax=Hymenobacter sp. B81 TaxID=3344878 RepID=UPI0037DDBA62
MKMFTGLLAATALLATTAATAQNTGVQFGLKAGLNMAVLDGVINREANYKPGLHAGVFMRVRPSKRFAFQPEVVYSQQGCENRIPLFSGWGGSVVLESQTKLAYLNVPLLAKVYLGNVVNLQFGPQVGLLLSARETGETGYTSTPSGNTIRTSDTNVKKDYKSDVALCGGVGVDLPMGLTASARLNYGLTDINKNENQKEIREYFDIGGLHNRVLEFSLGYAFGGK